MTRLLKIPTVQALLVTLALGAFLLVDFLVLQPAQASGDMDTLAVICTRLATVIATPGLMAARLLFINDHHVLRTDMGTFYLVATAASCVWIFAVAWVLLRVRRRRAARRDEEGAGRRSFLRRAAGWSVVGGGALLGGYTVLVEPAWLRVVRIRLPLAGLPAALSGMKVAHLTDLHLGRYVSAGHLRRVVQLTNRERPDLVLLTGDYVHGSPGFIRPVFQLLAGLRARLGMAGVLGNHDHWEDTAESFKQMKAAGIHVLDNRRLFVGAAGITATPTAAGLCVAGVGDLWEDTQDLGVLADAPADMPRLLLSHNPDFAEVQQARTSEHRVDLMLAGHTHGGQVRLPGTRSIITPSRHGSKYAKGMVQGPAFPVFVSTGIGMTILPVRMLVRPEIVVFTLVPE